MENMEIDTAGQAAGKTFTQEEVNRIVSERLSREREKRTSELDEREKAVASRELAVMAREKLEAAGLNKDLFKVLRFDSEADLDEAITHLQGMKGFSAGSADPEPEKKKPIIIENKLPIGEPAPESDDIAFRKAFGLHG